MEEFKSRLFRWYDEYEREHGDADITRIQELTTAMVRGKKGKAQMDLKAAETKWLCFFMKDLLAELGDDFPLAAVWRATSVQVVRHITLMDTSPWRLERSTWLDSGCTN